MRRRVCGNGSRLIGALLLSLLLASPSAFGASFSDVPPFDPTKTYQVQGTQLEQLRLDWIQLEKQLATLNQQLTTSEESFKTFKKETETELWVLRIVAAALASIAIYITIK